MYLPTPNFLALLALVSFSVAAQPKQNVRYTYLLQNEQPAKNEKTAFYVEESWQENGQWKAILTQKHSNIKVAQYGYADSTRNLKHGECIYYYETRKASVQNYDKGKKHGVFMQWDRQGHILQEGKFLNDEPVDTFRMYTSDRKLKMFMVYPKNGEAYGIEYMVHTGGVGKGPMKGLKQFGVWEYRNKQGIKTIEVTYDDNGIASEKCFDASGNATTTGLCVSDRRPEFPGGPDGWSNYLRKNLKYPKQAIKDNVQGEVLVQFDILTDGSVYNIKVVSAPSPELGDAAVKLLEQSPKWQPAIEMNQVIKFTHSQSITFYLQ